MGRPALAAAAVAGGLMLMHLGAGCGAQAVPALAEGARLFESPSLSTDPANRFACSTCHAREAGGAARHPGYPLGGAARRPSFWGGAEVSLLDATNVCLGRFQRGAPLGADADDGRALFVYLASLPGEERALPFTTVANVDASYDRALPAGDAARGATSYAAACAGCHGALGSGDGRLGTNVPMLGRCAGCSTAPRLRAIEKVRHGSFLGAGGVMPPFSLEALADGELADVLAALGL